MIAPVKVPIIQDTREQYPWSFNSERFTVEVGTLRTGDYAVKGLEETICIERKSLGDAVSAFIHDWTRERKKFYRMAGFDHAILVVEATPADILDHKYESDAEPLAVLGRLNSIMIDHGIPVVFAGSRAVAETFAERWLLQAAKKCGAAS